MSRGIIPKVAVANLASANIVNQATSILFWELIAYILV